MPVTRLASSGHAIVDRLLSGAIGLYVAAFPKRVRAAYLFGSYADGSVVPGGDVDLDIFFDTPLSETDLQKFSDIAQDIVLVAPVRIDTRPFSARHLRNGAPPALMEGKLLYGEDLAARVGLEPLWITRRRDLRAAFRRIRALRGDARYLTAPVDHPSRSLPYFGYVRREAAAPLRALVDTVTVIAKASLCVCTGRQIASKQRAVNEYRIAIGDDCAPLVADLYEFGKLKWHYAEPATAAERRHLNALCARLPHFENQFLSRCRAALLNDVESSNSVAIAAALSTVRDVTYADEAFVDALRRLRDSKRTTQVAVINELLQGIESRAAA